jgi:hypothetical protein
MADRRVLTVVWLLHVHAMLPQRQTQVIHGQHNPITILLLVSLWIEIPNYQAYSCSWTSSARSCAVDSELGEVECVAREVRNEFLGGEGKEALSAWVSFASEIVASVSGSLQSWIGAVEARSLKIVLRDLFRYLRLSAKRSPVQERWFSSPVACTHPA